MNKIKNTGKGNRSEVGFSALLGAQHDETQPSEYSRGVAAQAWCVPTTEKIVFMPELAEEFARIIEKYREALIWCSGSADFGQDGQAGIGWKKICESLLRT